MPDFTGKVVVFYVADPPRGVDTGVIMEYVEFRRFGDRLFVVGRIPENAESQWVSRLQSGVAWDAVVHYLVFDSREDYARRAASAKPGFLQRLAGRGDR